MCTIYNDNRSAMVCDVAISHVRQTVGEAFGGPEGSGARFTVRHGEGTLVERDEDLDPQRFRAAVEEGMSRAASQP
jgi:hypothetical protein